MYRFRKTLTVLTLFAFIVIGFIGCSESSEPSTPIEPTKENGSKVPQNKREHTKLITDSGTFSGRIDDLSIEIQISGVPEEKGYRAFELSNELRESFDSYGFEEGDQVLFQYEPSLGESRPVIVKIEELKNPVE